MSQERPSGNSNAEHRTEPNHPQQAEEVTTAGPTPNRFWRMTTNRGSHHCPDLDTLLSDSVDSLKEQVCQVHQRLDEVQKEVLKSKGEVGESSKGGSPFTPEIQDKPLPANFRLPALELYDDSYDPAEHVATFRA
ncbi:hypothetical protein BHE74_00057337 [Ensete ventricosum]|nr:hypothetical protein BHE74_00057337 [Ensete ventricosum]